MKVFLPTDPALPSFARDAFDQGACHALDAGDAKAALWLEGVPPVTKRRVGTIGSFSADSEKAATAVLREGERLLKEHGVDYLLGPMNGNTWRYPRLVSESTDRAPFLCEPRNPPAYLDYFLAAGFQPLSHYSSALVDLRGPRPDLGKLERKLEASGVRLRALTLEHFDQDLADIFEVCLVSFSRNFLYTPLEKQEFLSLYAKARDQIVPELVRLAFHGDRVVGFLFALPDLEAAARDEPPAVLLKTLAVLPEQRFAGLGTLLVDQVQQAAQALGFTEAIHALQHESNSSLRVSQRFQAQIFRRYTLLAKSLA